jgi:hypothetical protein
MNRRVARLRNVAPVGGLAPRELRALLLLVRAVPMDPAGVQVPREGDKPSASAALKLPRMVNRCDGNDGIEQPTRRGR